MESSEHCCAKRSAALAALVVLAGLAAAADVEDFYKGRNVSLIIGYSVGGGYDAYARLLARYIGKHIPGEPSIIPQQMAGAGSLRAANYIYSVAAKDGSVFGTFSRSMGIAPLIDKAEFDSRKFTWLGSVTDDNTICVTSERIADQEPGMIFSASRPSSAAWARLPIRISGRCSTRTCSAPRRSWSPAIRAPTTSCWRWSAAKSTACAACPGARSRRAIREWLTDHSVNIIVQAALKKEPEIDVGAARDRSRQQSGAASDHQAPAGEPGHGAAVRGAARHPGGPQGGADRGLRRRP